MDNLEDLAAEDPADRLDATKTFPILIDKNDCLRCGGFSSRAKRRATAFKITLT